VTPGAALAALIAAAAPFEVEPSDVTALQRAPKLACDAAGCTVAWNRLVPTDFSVSMRWLDGGVTSSADCGMSFRCELEGLSGWNGMRFYVLDGEGTNGEYGVFLAITTAPNEAPSTQNAVPLEGAYYFLAHTGFAASSQRGMLAFDSLIGTYANVLLRPLEPDGGFAADASTPVPQGANSVVDPAVAETGGVFYVLYFDRRDLNQLDPYLVAVGPDAAALAPEVQLATTTDDEYSGVLVAAADHLLVAWQRNNVVELSRVELDGGHGAPLLAVDGGFSPVLSFSGDAGLFGFARSGSGVSIELYRLFGDGTVGALVFSAQSPADSSLSLQQVDPLHAYLAYTVDDGGVSRAWVAPIDLTQNFDGGASLDAGPTADGGVGPRGPYKVSCGCEEAPGMLLLLCALIAAKLRRVGPRLPQ
jgi:hypothetical protein